MVQASRLSAYIAALTQEFISDECINFLLIRKVYSN